jgi:hypothetical protein
LDDKYNEAKTQVETTKPIVEAHNSVVTYCQQNGINNDDFASALRFASLLKNDPMKFKEEITPLLEGLGVLTGDKLPADLQKKVDEGTLENDVAKELASLRAQQQFGQNKTKLTEEQRAAQQQQQLVTGIQTAWSEWGNGKAKQFPDFKPKTDASKPDGLWEMVNDKMTALGQALDGEGKPRFPVRNQQEAVALAEAAWKSVTATFNSLKPKPSKGKHLSSNGSGTTSSNSDPMKAKTMEEALRLRFAELGGTE